MALDLYAGIPISDFDRAVDWYERLFGAEPFLAGDEAVWDLAEHRSVFIELAPERAGTARHTIFVDDLDALVAGISSRGIEPASRETYDNGIRKANYLDADGNDISFGGAPLE